MRLPPPPEQKTISSGSQERWESTSWVLGQENKFSFPGVIFLHRFLCCFFGGGGGVFWFVLVAGRRDSGALDVQPSFRHGDVFNPRATCSRSRVMERSRE